MKKTLFLAFIALASLFFALSTYAQTTFVQAIKNCEEYSKTGSAKHNGEIFNILITLNKAKNNKCIYKEKIYQDKNYQMLTCEFKQTQQDFIAESMAKYNEEFKKEISKNTIFEAKLTTNGEVFQKYLVDPEICKITHSKK